MHRPVTKKLIGQMLCFVCMSISSRYKNIVFKVADAQLILKKKFKWSNWSARCLDELSTHIFLMLQTP